MDKPRRISDRDKQKVVKNFKRIRAQAEKEWRDLKTPEEPIIQIGTATCGRAAGALIALQTIEEELAKLRIKAKIIQVGCMGHCYAEPMVTITKPGYPPICYGYVTPGVASSLVKNFLGGDDPCFEFLLGALEENPSIPAVFELPRFKYEFRSLLRNCGFINPEDILQYIASGGYSGLVRALQLSPEEVIAEVKRAGLRGRGGAGFPTGRKWELCRKARSETRYVIGNADEGDPGAFMDRAILESDPHSMIEGMIIGGYAVGAPDGYIYVRAEYPLAVKRLQCALEQAEELGLLGNNILGSDFNFHLELMQGASAFVCGEETALIASIEGKRGMPYPRPPYPAISGLFGQPTCINNVKSFASASLILTQGAKPYASIGTKQSKGTAVFALAGKIVNAGLVEVPMGTTLRRLIFEVGGGIPKQRRFKAVQIGGPSGGCLPESKLDTPVDFASLTEAGTMMGSGGMVVLDEDNCMVDTARYFLEFTQKESCGKCTFCRLGTKQMLDILEDICKGEGKLEDIDLLGELGEDIKAGSLCNLGKTAPNPILTTIRYFREEYQAHILEHRCPALVCKELTAFYILPDKCERSCDACVGSCAVEAVFTGKKRIKVIDQSKCVKCGSCLDACPPQYDAVVRLSPISLVPPSELPPDKA